jgi:hypothetical protein
VTAPESTEGAANYAISEARRGDVVVLRDGHLAVCVDASDGGWWFGVSADSGSRWFTSGQLHIGRPVLVERWDPSVPVVVDAQGDSALAGLPRHVGADPVPVVSPVGAVPVEVPEEAVEAALAAQGDWIMCLPADRVHTLLVAAAPLIAARVRAEAPTVVDSATGERRRLRVGLRRADRGPGGRAGPVRGLRVGPARRRFGGGQRWLSPASSDAIGCVNWCGTGS